MFLMPMGGVELLVILAILLLFCGARGVSQLARSLGTGARELKKTVPEDADEGRAEGTSEQAPPARDEAPEAGEPRAK